MNSTRLSVHSKIIQVQLWKFRRSGISGPKFYLWNRTRDMLQPRKSQCNRRASQRICGKNRQQSNSAVLQLLISYRSGYRSSYSSLWNNDDTWRQYLRKRIFPMTLRLQRTPRLYIWCVNWAPSQSITSKKNVSSLLPSNKVSICSW